MATVRLSDVIIPEVYNSYSAVDDIEKTAFFQSGVVAQNDMLNQVANSGGHSVELPFWKDLDANQEPNLSSDNPEDKATPNKISTGRQSARVAYLNQWYSAADLAGELAGSSPNERIRARFATYWQRQWQRRAIATTNGVLAGNVANDDSDMVHDISVDDAANITSGQLFKRDAFTGSAFTLGDMVDGLGAIAVHSMVYKRMVDNDDVEFVKDSTGTMRIPIFMGKRVIVDDSMPVVPVTTGTGFKYTSVLFGEGAIGYGEGSPTVPMEVQRQGLEGNGGGVEYIGERKTWIVHPLGFKIASDPASISGFTNAELAAAGTFERVVERKNVPMAFLITNG